MLSIYGLLLFVSSIIMNKKKKEENELNEMVKNTINPSKKQLMSYSGATWPWNWVPLDPSYRFQP